MDILSGFGIIIIALEHIIMIGDLKNIDEIKELKKGNNHAFFI